MTTALLMALAAGALGAGEQALPQARPVPAASVRPLLLIHVMPWFEINDGEWGFHWKMNRSTEELKSKGRVASHYRPLIGAYDSLDPAVVELQTLWMRTAGFDGVLADWYGLQPQWDYPAAHKRTRLLFEQSAKAKLIVSVVFEDQTVKNTLKAGLITQDQVIPIIKETGAFLKKSWFPMPHWWRHEGRPVMMVFGPQHFGEAEWTIFRQEAGPHHLLTLHNPRPYGQGVFDWPYPNQGFAFNQRFPKKSEGWGMRIPVAFPRFHDWYEEGGQTGYPDLPDNKGQTLRQTLADALAMKPAALQVATWNDWQEGTQIEPSIEFGTRDLEAVQAARIKLDPRFPFRKDDLNLPLRLYRLRAKARVSQELDAIAKAIADGQPARARRLLDAAGAKKA